MNTTNHKITRRRALQAIVATGIGSALAPHLAAAPADGENPKKHTLNPEVYKHLPVLLETDVVVAGGGVAGCAAATAAARNGASTLLIEKNGSLGGMATLGLVAPIGATFTARTNKRLGGILWEVINDVERASKKYRKSIRNHECSTGLYKYILLDKVVSSGAEVLFQAFIVDVVKTGENINALVVATKSGLALVKGKVFIDASGDGDIMCRAGADYVLGSEKKVLATMSDSGDGMVDSTSPYDIQVDDYSGKLQPVSWMFNMGNVDTAQGRQYMNRKLTYSDLNITKDEFKKWKFYGTVGFEERDDDVVPMPQGRIWLYDAPHENEAIINMSRVVGINGADALSLSQGSVKAQQQLFALVDFLQSFVPGFQNAYLRESASTLGVRETRRLVGDYILSGSDVIQCATFPDVISHGSYIIDIHDPSGKRMAIAREIKGDFYDIPYRSLITQKVPNVIVAGRCISADHVAHSSTRIQGTSMLTGQAAGTAAAMAVENAVSLGAVDIPALQRRLLDAGMMLVVAAS